MNINAGIPGLVPKLTWSSLVRLALSTFLIWIQVSTLFWASMPSLPCVLYVSNHISLFDDMCCFAASPQLMALCMWGLPTLCEAAFVYSIMVSQSVHYLLP